MKLVIVESPAKTKKIQGFLGDDYQVRASYGHIRDLTDGLEAIDVEKNFKPSYRITKSKVVTSLRLLAKNAEEVIIASDLDREGEAIGFHLAKVLKLPIKTTKRIVFNQITKKAILKAMSEPRKLDEKMFNAQQARRVLDRLIGFTISPVLWKFVASKLSAGRCQSPALGLLYDKENDIAKFKLISSFSIQANFDIGNSTVEGKFDQTYETEDESTTFLKRCQVAYFETGDSKVTTHSSKSPPPFTTSSFQQAASTRGISPKSAMSIAQKLYEAGLITYMRTDSLNLSESCLADCKTMVESSYPDYHSERTFGKKSGSQDAHEAMHPVYMDRVSIEGEWDDISNVVYEMIYKRTLATQMKAKQTSKCILQIDMYDPTGEEDEYEQADEKATTEVSIVTFDGWTVLYGNKENDDALWDKLTSTGSSVVCECTGVTAIERFKKPPGRFTQAQLIKKLETNGIGRPSTFSAIMTTIVDRNYASIQNCEGTKKECCQLNWDPKNGDTISKTTTELKVGSEKKKLVLTDMGKSIVEFLRKHFSFVMNYKYTSNMEDELDLISKGQNEWQKCVKKTFNDMQSCIKTLADVPVANTKHSKKRNLLGLHPNTGKNVYVFIGKKGKVIQCGEEGDATFSIWKTRKALEKITLKDVLDQIPRDFGTVDGKSLVAIAGKHGLFVKHGDRNVSAPQGATLSMLTKEICVEILSKPVEEKKKSRQICKGLSVHEGPYGFYIRKGKTIRSLPNTLGFQTVTKEQCLAILKQPKKKRTKAKK